ncbi:sugar kinase [Arthrobacter parietis]|uniref:Sugar kinase n=1 Tax=Arthrobacter parietis TaxID=271434 RepID=A0ABP5MQI7_9MICC
MSGQSLPKAQVLTFGETMGSIRAAGLVRHGGAMSMSLGGAESNVAIGLARLGHSVRWVGRLGKDEVGKFALRTLCAEGVLTDAVVHDAHRPTGLMLLEKRIADVSRAAYYRAGSAGSALSFEDLAPALDAEPSILHFTGITPALSASASKAAVQAAETARERGITVSFDVNYRAKLWDREDAAEALSVLAGLADIVIASEDEIDLLGSSSAHAPEAELVDGLHARGVRDIIIKRGAEGATAYTADGACHCDAIKVPVVDTVGAGDAFTAGYLSAVLDWETLEERLHRGVTLGAFAVAATGDWENLPARNELSLISSAGTTIR